MYEDSKGVTRSRTFKKGRQYSGQNNKAKRKKTNNDL